MNYQTLITAASPVTAQITQARLVHSRHIYLLRRQWSLANVIQNNIICKEIQAMHSKW